MTNSSIENKVKSPKKVTKKVVKSITKPKSSKKVQAPKKRILILSWEIFPLFAGGLGFLARSVVDELILQNCEVVVLVPTKPKNMIIPNAESLERRTKFWLKKAKIIPNLDFPLDHFGQKKTNQTNWPALFSGQKLKNNKKFNIYPQNTPAITKAFAWSVLEFIRSNQSFDLIIGMDWETIPSFYALEDYFAKLEEKENLKPRINSENHHKNEKNNQKLIPELNSEKTEPKSDSEIDKSEPNKNKNFESSNLVMGKSSVENQNQNISLENLQKNLSKSQKALSSNNLCKAKIEILEQTKRPEFYFYINATELDRGPEQINQKETKNPILNLEKKTYPLAKKIISISDITRNILTDHYKVEQNRILTVYNDIIFEPNFEKFVGLSGGKNVLFIGRMEAQKGLIFLLETAVRVLEIDSQVKFFVAGDGDLLPSLIENMCEKGLEKSFFLTGWLGEEDKKRLYSSSDLFVMPSPSEPFGLTPLEAIRSNTAVISSQTCGFLSVVPSTPTFAYHDINNFAQLIIYYLHNPTERNKLLETQKLELAKHSWSREIAKILETLN